MKRIPAQGLLPLGRKERVMNRQWRERTSGKKVRRGPGRPKAKDAGVSHRARPELRPQSALHVTLRTSARVPNLRARRRFNAIKRAFVRCSAPEALGFRLVHFAVLSNHVHFVVEADSKRALSMGMQKLLHSISRRLNALSLREHGAEQRAPLRGGGYRALEGWLGRVFSDRYHAHLLRTPTEMARAVRYVLQNADHHYAATALGRARDGAPDPCTSLGASEPGLTAKPHGFLLLRACKRYRRPPR